MSDELHPRPWVAHPADDEGPAYVTDANGESVGMSLAAAALVGAVNAAEAGKPLEAVLRDLAAGRHG